jgi:mannitol operon repressor
MLSRNGHALPEDSMAPKRKKERGETARKRQDLQGSLDEFNTESDSATAILGAALLDESLSQLLAAFFVDDKKEVAALLELDQPLGSLGARIRASYCLGLVGRDLLAILKLVSGIRNAFAHQLHGLSFTDPGIAEECAKLRAYLQGPEDMLASPRQIFLRATMSAQLELWAMTRSIEVRGRRCTVPEWETLAESPSSAEGAAVS